MKTEIEFLDLNFKKIVTKDEMNSLMEKVEVTEFSKNHFFCKIDENVFELVIEPIDSTNFSLIYKGQHYIINKRKVFYESNNNSKKDSHKTIVIKSPMPGLISKIKVVIGQKVKKGDALLSIEAMKMENDIKSPIDCIIESINVNEGIVVEKNQALVVLSTIQNL